MTSNVQRQQELDASAILSAHPESASPNPEFFPSLSHSQPMSIANVDSLLHVASGCSSCERSPPLERRSHYRRHCRSRHRPLSHSSARAFKAAMLNEDLASDGANADSLAALHDEGLGDASSLDSASLNSVFLDESPERSCSDRRPLRDSGCLSHSPDKREPSRLRRCQSSP